MRYLLVLALFVSVPSFASDFSFLQLAEAPADSLAVPPGMTLQKMVTLTTDRDADKYHMHLMLDARSAPGGLFVEPDRGNKPDPQGVPNGTAFLLADIEKPAGVVVFRAQGYDVLIMQGQLNRETLEGRFHLKYLSNGLSGEYGSCDFLLKKGNQGYWVQNAYNGDAVSRIHVVTSFLGVDTLEGICPK